MMNMDNETLYSNLKLVCKDIPIHKEDIKNPSPEFLVKFFQWFLKFMCGVSKKTPSAIYTQALNFDEIKPLYTIICEINAILQRLPIKTKLSLADILMVRTNAIVSFKFLINFSEFTYQTSPKLIAEYERIKKEANVRSPLLREIDDYKSKINVAYVEWDNAERAIDVLKENLAIESKKELSLKMEQNSLKNAIVALEEQISTKGKDAIYINDIIKKHKKISNVLLPRLEHLIAEETALVEADKTISIRAKKQSEDLNLYNENLLKVNKILAEVHDINGMGDAHCKMLLSRKENNIAISKLRGDIEKKQAQMRYRTDAYMKKECFNDLKNETAKILAAIATHDATRMALNIEIAQSERELKALKKDIIIKHNSILQLKADLELFRQQHADNNYEELTHIIKSSHKHCTKEFLRINFNGD